MKMMKAVGIAGMEDTALRELELPIPNPVGRELLVKVSAVALNPVDAKQRKRIEKSPRVEPVVFGWDAVGTVVSIGAEASLFQVGDQVYYAGDITKQGSNAEFQTIDERLVGKKPESLSIVDAAALPLTGLTAWEGLFDRLRISGSEAKTILVIGAAGGVGSLAIQLLKQLTKLKVIGTASRQESADWVRSLGADEVVDHRDLVSSCHALGIKFVDYIFCLNDTDGHWESMAELIAPQGLICSIVETSAPLDIDKLKMKSAGFVWELMFTRSLFQTDDMIRQHEILNELSHLVDEGHISTTVTKKLVGLTAENFREGHALIESGRTIGKIVIQF